MEDQKNKQRINYRKLLRYLPALLALFIGGLFLFQGKPAEAALNNSYVIPDSTFSNAGSMNEAQIQAFLVAHGSYLATYHIPAGHSEVYQGVTYYEGTWVGPIGSEMDATNWSAAHLIYMDAQWYGINPQVLLATLQKESSLVTNGSPWYGYMMWAMGYAYTESGINPACGTSTNHNPSGSCAGFAMQMDWAAGGLAYWQSLANAQNKSTQYWTGNTIPIDGQSIFLGNGATAALYRYTPHIQTNFYNIFTLWFSPYDYSLSSQMLPDSYMQVGSTKSVYIILKNTGTATWYNEVSGGSFPTRLQVANADGTSFYTNDGNWLSSTRIKMATASVAPGQYATFSFTIKTPATPGYHCIKFLPIVENLMQMPNNNLYMSMTTNGNYNYQFVSQVLPDMYMNVGTTKQLQIVLKNTGTATWYNEASGGSFPTRLQVANADGTSFYTNDGNWLPSTGQTRIKLQEVSVPPGSNGTFIFTMKAPPPTGYHSIHFVPIVENFLQMPNNNLYMSMTSD